MGLTKSTQPVMRVGGVEIPTNRAGLKLLVAKTSAANAYSCFRAAGSATDYVVPAGKTLKCIAFWAQETQGGACNTSIGYGDTASAWGGGAVPTNPISMVGGGAASSLIYLTGSSRAEFPVVGFNIPTGKYPYAYDDSGAGGINMYLWAIEE